MPPTLLPLIGYPISRTPPEGVLSRALESAGSAIGIERWERRPHQVAAALAEIRAGDEFAGALIASPHKEKAPPLSDWLSDDARLSGAVSLFVRAEGRLRGHNIDADGVRAGLAALLPATKAKWPKNAVVLGAGGAARASVAVLIDAGFAHVAVLNRHLHKAEALVGHFSRTARQTELRARPWHDAIIEAELARAELLINASGIGTDAVESPIPTELVPPERFVLDLVIGHLSTPLMDAARSAGGTAANGHAALLASTASVLELVTGAAPPADALHAALAAELGLPVEELSSGAKRGG